MMGTRRRLPVRFLGVSTAPRYVHKPALRHHHEFHKIARIRGNKIWLLHVCVTGHEEPYVMPYEMQLLLIDIQKLTKAEEVLVLA